METPSFGNKRASLKSPEKTQENIVLSEQEKNIQEVFKLNPELQQIASESLGYNLDYNGIKIELGRSKKLSYGTVQNINVIYNNEKIVNDTSEAWKTDAAKVVTIDMGNEIVVGNIVFPQDIRGKGLIKNLYQAIADKLGKPVVDSLKYQKEIGPGYGQSEPGSRIWKNRESFTPHKLSPIQEQKITQLYGEYIKDIFPESKVQDIVWHNSPEPIIEFTKQNDGLGYFFFAKGKDSIWKLLADPENGNPNQYAVKINTVKPKVEDFDSSDHDGQTYRMKFAVSEGFDAVLIENKENPEDSERVVFNNSQIHILGSEKDIEKFKEFIETKNRS